jgi:MFS family permease
MAAVIGHWAYLVAVSIYAYGVGGEAAVGLVFFVRLIPSALIAPFAGMLADRYRRESVLVASAVSRIVLIGAAAAGVFLDVEPAVVYTLAVLAAIATTPFRPAQAALTPSLARTPDELTAANAVASTIESIAIFVGPALAGLLLAIASTGLVFVVTASMLVLTAFFLLQIHAPRAAAPKGEVAASTIASEALAGFRTIGQEPPLRVLIGLLGAQTLVLGALQVYIVVVSIEVLGLGRAGVGYLNSAIGVGAVVGAMLAVGLAGSRRLSPSFVSGVVLLGAPIAVIGLWSQTAAVLVLLGITGFGSSLLDVSGLTLVQRAVPEDVLARVFGIIQMLFLGTLGVGAIFAPVLIDWLGTEGALIATGLFLVGLTILLAPRLAGIDASAKAPDPDELRLLGGTPIFAPLPGTTLEHVAARLTPLRIEPGDVIVRQGDAADRFYIIAEGEVEVSQDGMPVSELGAGDYFGEIALMRDVPRTATVTARTPVVLYALDRDDFLAAVTGHPPSTEAAETVVSSRLSSVAAARGRLPTA